jgi:hypothetical protein
MIKDFFAKILSIITALKLYWVLIWPIFFAMAVISDKYFGKNNFYEQFIEGVNKYITGINVDISKESSADAAKDNEPHDVKKYLPNEQ